MQTRRYAIALAGVALAAALVVSPLARSEADTGHPASTFLDTMREQAITGLTDSTRSDEEREALFRNLLNETFDIKRIGRFVVGRYWRQAEAEDQEAFLQAFDVEGEATQRGLTYDNYLVLIQSALRGEGIALCGRRLAEDFIAQGDLVRPIQQSLKSDRGFYLLRPKDQPLSHSAREFHDWLLAEAGRPE